MIFSPVDTDIDILGTMKILSKWLDDGKDGSLFGLSLDPHPKELTRKRLSTKIFINLHSINV